MERGSKNRRVVGTSSGSCPVVHFGTSIVENVGSAAVVLLSCIIRYLLLCDQYHLDITTNRYAVF